MSKLFVGFNRRSGTRVWWLTDDCRLFSDRRLRRRPGRGSSNCHFRKLDMPVFDGTDPDGWVLRIERYYNFYRITEEKMLDAAAVAIEGEALSWY